MNIKLQIKKPIVSGTEDIHSRVLTFLDSSGYRIVQNTQQNISFDDEKSSQWILTSNLRYYQLTEGKFDLAVSENAKTLKLICNVDITFETLFLVLSLCCGIFVDHIYLFGSLFIISSLFLKFFFLWYKGSDMMKTILR